MFSMKLTTLLANAVTTKKMSYIILSVHAWEQTYSSLLCS